MRKYFAAAVLTTTLMFGASANAALEVHDWVAGSGDQWITRDTATGFDWLDVPLTANQTFDEVRLGEWYARGFRHATQAELSQLFEHAGTPDDGFDLTNTHPAETAQLISMLGATLVVGDDRMSTAGFVGTDFFGQNVTGWTHPVGTPFSALLGKIHWLDLNMAGLGMLGEGHFTGGHPFSNEADATFGSFLVLAPVPEPSTYALFMAGIVFVALRFRQSRQSD